MRFLFPKVFSLFCLWFIFLSNAYPVHALTKFNTSYQVYYKVADNGLTHVTFVISQKNNLSIVYATEFGISLNETKMTNLTILDEGVAVTANIVKNDNQTLLSFPFAKKVVGKDKVHNFTIDYDTTDIVSKQGNTWQINIPRFESDENVTDQTAILTLPANFPQPAYIDPKPDIVNGSTYYFSSKILANKPISAIFGNNQYYKGKLKYYLANPTSASVESSITLPPNTAYQSVFYQSIKPEPTRTEIDQDGNLLAYYHLKPRQEIDIESTVYLKTDFLPRLNTIEKTSPYLSPSKIWDYNHNLFTIPELKSLTSPKAIYDYVANKLKYDYQKINSNGTVRVPASESLKNYLTAICTDYTDLFVALARKASIPARELEGLAISENSDLKPISSSTDILHAWPEYYDETKNLWIQIDPTWGSTTRGMDYFNKLDFNHIVFAIHGLDSFNPQPVGAFKRMGDKNKNLNFESIEEVAFPEDKFTIVSSQSTSQYHVFTLKNLNGTYLNTSVSSPETNNTKSLEDHFLLPPFGEKEISIKKKAFLFGRNQSEVIININGTDFNPTVSSNNFFSKNSLLAGTGLLLGLITLIARSLFLRKRA